MLIMPSCRRVLKIICYVQWRPVDTVLCPPARMYPLTAEIEKKVIKGTA